MVEVTEDCSSSSSRGSLAMEVQKRISTEDPLPNPKPKILLQDEKHPSFNTAFRLISTELIV